MIGAALFAQPATEAAYRGLSLDCEHGVYRAGGQAYDRIEDIPGFVGTPRYVEGGIEHRPGDPILKFTDLDALGLERRASHGVRFEIEVTPAVQQDSLFPWLFAFHNADGPTNDRHGVYYFTPAQEWRLLTRYGGPENTALHYGQSTPLGQRVRVTGAMDVTRQEGRLGVRSESERGGALSVSFTSQTELWLFMGDASSHCLMHLLDFKI